MSRESISGRGRILAEAGTPFGINLGLGAVSAVAAVTAAAVVRSADHGWRLEIVAAVVAGFAALTGDARTTAPTAAIAWLLVDGFPESPLAELSWHGRLDLESTAAMVAAGAGGLAFAAGRRFVRELRSWQRLINEFRALRAQYTKSAMPILVEEREEHDA